MDAPAATPEPLPINLAHHLVGCAAMSSASAKDMATSFTTRFFRTRATRAGERAMLATSVAVSKQVIGERRAFPTPAEVCAVALPQHLRKYAEHVPGKVSRGEAEMMQKCASAILKFKNGGFEGMETLEKIIASYERERREDGKLPATAMSSEPHVVTDPGPFPATDFRGTPPARSWVVPDLDTRRHGHLALR